MKTSVGILSLFTLINLSSCCLGPSKHLKFTDEDLKILFYEDGYEIKMISNLGDTIKTRTKSKFITVFENTCGGSMCECDQFQSFSITFPLNNRNDSHLSADKENNKLNMYIYLNIENEQYFADAILDHGKIISNGGFFYDTLRINNILYSNVYEFTDKNNTNSLASNKKKSHVFYNNTYGIIRLAKDSAKTWTLIN